MSTITEAVAKYKYSLAIWTDKTDFIVDKNEALKEEKLLEIRCFDESGEFRAYRSSIASNFKEREITDDEAYADFFIDESQYLDIDEKMSTESIKYTTGGGTFTLPEGVNEKMMLVRTYYKYDDNGIARKYDWRLVGFTNDETVGRRDK